MPTLYYGRTPLYNYWNGCSTGGHQGMDLAQKFAGEVQGILAVAPAMYWTRFATAQLWGQIAMYDIAHEVIAAGKLAAVQNAAIAACDRNDGVRTALSTTRGPARSTQTANVCGQPSAPAAPNCLTPTEANAVNVMWDGPRNDSGNRIWFPIDRGTDFTFLGWKRAVLPDHVWMGSGKSGLLQRRRLPDLLPWLLGQHCVESSTELGSRYRDQLRGRRAGWVE